MTEDPPAYSPTVDGCGGPGLGHASREGDSLGANIQAVNNPPPPSYQAVFTDAQPRTGRPRQPLSEAQQYAILTDLITRHSWPRCWGPPPRTLAAALRITCLWGAVPFCYDLLEAGAPLLFTDQHAATTSSCAVHQALRGPEPQFALDLIQYAGSRPDVLRGKSATCLLDARDEQGCTPLHVAASAGADDVVTGLLAWGAAVDTLDNMGRTPLVSAGRYKRWEAARLLVAGGASVELARNLWKGKEVELGRWEEVEAALLASSATTNVAPTQRGQATASSLTRSRGSDKSQSDDDGPHDPWIVRQDLRKPNDPRRRSTTTLPTPHNESEQGPSAGTTSGNNRSSENSRSFINALLQDYAAHPPHATTKTASPQCARRASTSMRHTREYERWIEGLETVQADVLRRGAQQRVDGVRAQTHWT